MTKIEEKFYKTFEIEPVKLSSFNYNVTNFISKTIELDEKRYLKITDRILLELICIENNWDFGEYESSTIEELKEEVLGDLIYYCNAIGEKGNEELKAQVQALFEVK